MSSREFKSFDELNRKLKKSVLLSGQARHALLAGITAVADVARVTLGPTGRAVCFGNDGTPPLLTCDGVTVAENITLPNRHHNIGAQLLKQAATATRDKAGDGSTTTVVLAQELIREGLKLITAGANPMVFRRGLVKGAAAVQAALERMKRPVTTMAELQQIATAAANDPEIGQLVSQMISRLGPQGFINIQDGSGLGFQVEYHPGMHWYDGYVSTAFVTDPKRDEAVLENAYVLVTDRKLSRIEEIAPIMDQLVRAGTPTLLVIAEAVTGAALATLVINCQQGGFRCLAVKPPAYGAQRKAMLRDIAIFTGATLFSDETGRPLGSATIADLGQVERVVASHRKTTLIGGKGSADQVERLIREIRTLIQTTQDKTERDKLWQRLARLASGVMIVQVGGLTEAHRKERRRRLENALAAARGAVEEGVVVGGGVAFLNATEALANVRVEDPDEALALHCLRQALEAPTRQLAVNAGQDPGAVIGQVRWLQQKWDNPCFGYDVLRGEYGDLMERGVMDPLPVVRAALRNAVSLAWIILSVEATVGIIPGQKVRFTEPSERRRQWALRRQDLRERARRAGGRLRPPQRIWAKPKGPILEPYPSASEASHERGDVR